MDFIEILSSILGIVVFLNAISSLIIYIPKNKNKKYTETQNGEKWLWKDTAFLTLIILSTLITVIIPIWLLDNSILESIVVFSFFLKLIVQFIPSATVLKNIVSEKSGGNLNVQEFSALYFLAIIFGYSKTFDIPEKIQMFAESLNNFVLADLITTSFYIVFTCMCIFFISTLILNPLKLLIKIAKKVVRFISKKKINYILSKLEYVTNRQFYPKTFFVSIIEYAARKENKLLKILLGIVSILLGVIDIIRITVELLASYLVSILYFIFLLLKQICHILRKICIWIEGFSDKTFIAISFRLAIILGLSCTVILNRYNSFLYNEDNSTAVLEFITSAIIIPVIFEWISSYKNKKQIKSNIPTSLKEHR